MRAAIADGLAPEASVRVTQLVFGPYTPFPVEFRIMGPDAVIEATVQRTCPVILTALAAVLAFIPPTHSVFWGSMA